VISPPGGEDPISAIFDLSDRVAQMAPTVRRMYRYTAVILVIWIAIMAALVLIGIAASAILALLAILGLAAGVIGLSLLRQTDRFFRAFALRNRFIRLLREADAEPKIPEGRTPIERLVRHLALSNARVDAALKEDPGRARLRVTYPAGAQPVAFDLVVSVPGSAWYRTLGWGDPGFAILARTGPDAPVVADLERMAADAQAVSGLLGCAVVRLLLLRTQAIPLPEDVYEHAVGHPAVLRHRFHESRVPVEVATERPDGTYEFIPTVLGVP